MSTFVIIATFAFELCQIAVDKHMLRLAAYESGRIYSSANYRGLTVFGAMTQNPCEQEQLSNLARNAALKRVAAIVPRNDLIFKGALESLGVKSKEKISNVFEEGMSVKVGKFIAERWLSAILLTHIRCEYDARLQEVEVQVTYQRPILTPFAGPIFRRIFDLFGDEWEVDFSKEAAGRVGDFLKESIQEKISADTLPATIRLSERVSMSSVVQSNNLKFHNSEPIPSPWRGNLVGSMMLDGRLRSWAHRLNSPSQYLSNEEAVQ